MATKWEVTFASFHIRAAHVDIIKVLFISPTDALVSCLKNNIKIYIKIYIFKTAH